MQENKIDIFAEIKKGIEYTPLLCKKLTEYKIEEIEKAISKDATFILKVNEHNIAVSWWVSPKRTRSYPYARVYDSFSFSGKKATIIPIIKDEGKDGDRDFLQWDTISLMSLLGIYAIISYYSDASKSSRYKNKITKQKFDISHIKEEIRRLIYYQSDALHWNLSQIDKVGEISQKAFDAYRAISKKLGVQMHSWESAKKRIEELQKGRESFMSLSRKLAKKAQKRERETIQPKEHLTGIKATLTIKNYLGGYYYFTCDEVELHGKDVYLIEGKHTKRNSLPSLGDIKDGLLKMMLFTSLENVKINKTLYNPVPILKLTTGNKVKINSLRKNNQEILKILIKEGERNKFKIMINDTLIKKVF